MAKIQLSGLPETTTPEDTDYVLVSKSGIDYRMSTENYSKGTFPIGTTYTQYPNKSSPSELGLVGTWENISSEFAGDFFRAEGGNASTFESGEQLDAFQGFNIGLDSQSTTQLRPFLTGNVSSGGTDQIISSGSPSTNRWVPIIDDKNEYGTPRVDIETRAINKTIRIWERTA